MKKVIFGFTLCILFHFSLSVFSQAEKRSDEILKGVSAKYKAMTSMKADFQLVFEEGQSKKTDTQIGALSLKGEKYYLKIKGQEVYSDGKVVWTFLPEANEVQVSEPENNPEAVSPKNIFTMYERGFDHLFVEEKLQDGKTLQVIELKPQDLKKNFFKIRLTIDKKDKLIVSSVVYNKNGSKATYTIKSFTPNPPLPDAHFTFDKAKHPGVEVIDLR